MKTFRRYSAAKKAANGLPIIRFGSGKNEIYLVSEGIDLVGLKISEISLIAPDGYITGHITLSHLDRLGNGNHAFEKTGWTIDKTCFPKAPKEA